MNAFAKFDEIPSMILQDIKETKRYGHNVKTVYPPTNTVCGGYNEPRHEKSCLRGFPPGPKQTGLYNHRKRLEA